MLCEYEQQRLANIRRNSASWRMWAMRRTGSSLHTMPLMCNRQVTGAQSRQWWATVIVCVQQQSGAMYCCLAFMWALPPRTRYELGVALVGFAACYTDLAAWSVRAAHDLAPTHELTCASEHWRLHHPAWSGGVTVNHKRKASVREQHRVHALLGRLLARHVPAGCRGHRPIGTG